MEREEEDTTGNEGRDLSQRYGNLAREPLTMSENKQTLSLLVFQLQLREKHSTALFLLCISSPGIYMRHKHTKKTPKHICIQLFCVL